MTKLLYKCIIHGNQEDTTGNPLGYFRTTQGSYWNDGSKRYHAWKDYVVKHFCNQTGLKERIRAVGKSMQVDKPIVLEKGQTAELHIKIRFKNDVRSDCDNVYKGIADALFKNDKQIMKGSFEAETIKGGVGIVEIVVVINSPIACK